MKKLSFKNRIRTGFFVVITIMMTAIFYSVWQLLAISHKMETVYKYSYKVSTSIRDAQIEIYKTARILRNIEFAHSENKLEQIIKQTNESDSLIDEYMKIVENQYLGKKEDIELVNQELYNWTVIREKTFQLKRENKIDSLELILQSKEYSQVTEIINRTKTISYSASLRIEAAMQLINARKET